MGELPQARPPAAATIGAMQPPRAERRNRGQPIITRDQLRAAGADAQEARNVNGPSLIALPDWIPPAHRADPAARYYCYFAHHGGHYIRLAWAEHPEGPWRLHRTDAEPGARGVLDLGPPPPGSERPSVALGDDLALAFHIASPDAHLDPVHRRVVLYVHGPVTARGSLHGQHSLVATSADGLDFHRLQHQRDDGHGLRTPLLCPSYLRAFWLRGRLFGLSSRGQVVTTGVDRAAWDADPEVAWRTRPGRAPSDHLWTVHDGPLVRTIREQAEAAGVTRRARHVAVAVADDRLEVFYSAVGDAPERLVRAVIDTRGSDDPGTWTLDALDQEILRPERAWEGADIRQDDGTIRPSRGGWAEDVNELRDPALLVAEGRRWLAYSGAGESALGLAELRS